MQFNQIEYIVIYNIVVIAGAIGKIAAGRGDGQVMKNAAKISIRAQIVLYTLLLVSTSLIVYAIFRVNTITYNQSLNYNNHLRYHIANSLFRQGTDLLTDAVRRYVVTMRPGAGDGQ